MSEISQTEIFSAIEDLVKQTVNKVEEARLIVESIYAPTLYGSRVEECATRMQLSLGDIEAEGSGLRAVVDDIIRQL